MCERCWQSSCALATLAVHDLRSDFVPRHRVVRPGSLPERIRVSAARWCCHHDLLGMPLHLRRRFRRMRIDTDLQRVRVCVCARLRRTSLCVDVSKRIPRVAGTGRTHSRGVHTLAHGRAGSNAPAMLGSLVSRAVGPRSCISRRSCCAARPISWRQWPSCTPSVSSPGSVCSSSRLK